jgi:hypothetical protein
MGKVQRWLSIVDSPETLAVLCARVSEGEALADVCRAWGVPKGQVGKWLMEDKSRMQAYENALALWADNEAQACMAIADGASPEDVSVAKLQIDTRLKLASKWNAQRYGDNRKVEVSGNVGLIAMLASITEDEPPAIDVTPEKEADGAAATK